jgi:hypothetical protein
MKTVASYVPPFARSQGQADLLQEEPGFSYSLADRIRQAWSAVGVHDVIVEVQVFTDHAGRVDCRITSNLVDGLPPSMRGQR